MIFILQAEGAMKITAFVDSFQWIIAVNMAKTIFFCVEWAYIFKYMYFYDKNNLNGCIDNINGFNSKS